MKKFENPLIKITMLDFDDVTITSGNPSTTQSAAQLLAEEMKATATAGVNVVDWSMYSE